MSEEDPIIESPLLKMKKGGLSGRTYWKEHWVYADSEELQQWGFKHRPLLTDKPKYGKLLKDLILEEVTYRDFAFQLTDIQNTEDSMVFACSNFEEYQEWISYLSRFCYRTILLQLGDDEEKKMDGASSSGRKKRSAKRSNKPKEDLPDTPEERKQRYFSDLPTSEYLEGGSSNTGGSDMISDFFYRHCVSELDQNNPLITQQDLKKLIELLDPTVNTKNTLAFICQDRKIVSQEALVPYTDFLSWWSMNKCIFNPSFDENFANTAQTQVDEDGNRAFYDPYAPNLHTSPSYRAPTFKFKDSSHFPGLLDTEFDEERHQRPNYLYRLSKAPKVSSYARFRPPSFDDVEDLDALYQALLEYVSIMQHYNISEEELDVHPDVKALWERYGLPSNDQGDPCGNAVQAWLSCAALKGVFYKLAIEGTRKLVDEFTLPDHLKTGRRIDLPSIPLQERSTRSIGESDNQEEVYGYAGLLFRVIGKCADDRFVI